LTEGWDCNAVTHIVGLRPFMSQLLCEQVVGRGLRRRTYELGDNGLMTEEVAKVFGVPFQVIPFKANPTATPKPTEKRHHVYALPGRSHLEITFPRVEGYRQAIRNRVVVDWTLVPPLFLDPFIPYYGWAIERLVESIRPDTAQGEAPEVPRYETSRGPGSTADVDYWTSKDVREVVKSHLNYVVADTAKWEQQAAYVIDTHPAVESFAKNAGLGFAIPYIHNDQPHDYVPDFIIRLETDPPAHLILETKGFDHMADVKAAAAERWVTAVNADGRFGRWRYAAARKVEQVRALLDGVQREQPL